MMPSDYRVPSAPLETEYEVKKSRFITWLNPVENREQAMACLTTAKQRFPDARHHCWAYMIGNPGSPSLVAMSDDGEPSGTAGKPILNVLQHKNVGDIMLIVVRYFGGIKLGAGGLVRAYSSAAQKAMDTVVCKAKIFLTEVELQGNFALEQSIRHWLSEREGEIVSVDYAEQVNIRVTLREGDIATLQSMMDALGGSLRRLE
ncbi:MAG: YigZ family protein [Agarilytica sp.]